MLLPTGALDSCSWTVSLVGSTSWSLMVVTVTGRLLTPMGKVRMVVATGL